MDHQDELRAGVRSRPVHLKRGSSRDTVLVVPGLGGSALTLVALARAYPGPEHVVGLERAALAGTAHESVTELAARHLEAAVQPPGSGSTWHLVGHCFGATVAMEMAHQLERGGERLGAIALVQPLLRLGGAMEEQDQRLADARQRALDDPRPLDVAGDLSPRLLEHVAFALHAYRDHAPRPISHPVHVFVTTDTDVHVPGTIDRLREVTGGVQHHELPGTSAGVLRHPFARDVARRIASLAAGG